jgi:hypothetical protein
MQGKDAQIFMCHVAEKKEAGMQQCKKEFLQRILAGICFSVGSIFVHSIVAFVLMVEAGI